MSAYDLGSKSNRQRRAWRKLNAAMIRYEEKPDFTVEDLNKAYEGAKRLSGM